jgi:hypothetical protein
LIKNSNYNPASKDLHSEAIEQEEKKTTIGWTERGIRLAVSRYEYWDNLMLERRNNNHDMIRDGYEADDEYRPTDYDKVHGEIDRVFGRHKTTGRYAKTHDEEAKAYTESEEQNHGMCKPEGEDDKSAVLGKVEAEDSRFIGMLPNISGSSTGENERKLTEAAAMGMLQLSAHQVGFRSQSQR